MPEPRSAEVSKALRIYLPPAEADPTDRQRIFYFKNLVLKTTKVSGLEGTVTFEQPKVPPFGPLVKYLPLAENLISSDFEREELNVGALKNSFASPRYDLERRVGQLLSFDKGKIENCVDKEFIGAFNALLRIPDFHDRVEADRYALRPAVRKLLNANPGKNVRILNRALLQDLFRNETRMSHLLHKPIFKVQSSGEDREESLRLTVSLRWVVEVLDGGCYINLKVPAAPFPSKYLGKLFEAIRQKVAKMYDYDQPQKLAHIRALRTIFEQSKRYPAGDQRHVFLEQSFRKMPPFTDPGMLHIDELREDERSKGSGNRLSKRHHIPNSFKTFVWQKINHLRSSGIPEKEIVDQTCEDANTHRKERGWQPRLTRDVMRQYIESQLRKTAIP